MKVLMINSVCGIGSTGRICTDLATKLESEGHIVKIGYGRKDYVPEQYKKYSVKIGTKYDVILHALMSRMTDKSGFYSERATRIFLEWANDFDPDILWLHNIHGYYINVEMLFDWIKKRPDMVVKWTLHDCWAFTGHCSHFSYAKCDKWKVNCSNCIQKKEYPASIFIDNSFSNFFRKRDAFTGVKNMTLITPSRWLAGLVKQSFLKDYRIEVIYNNIDENIFKPRESNFREEYNLIDKKIILGVANIWNKRKGLDDFIKLSRIIDDTYKIVLVGLNDKQIKCLPKNIVGIKRTNSTYELAGLYTAADVFVNPTYEDNYPTVNLEAKACGTPVITYRTGGSVESVPDENVVEVGDVEGLLKKIKQLLGMNCFAK